MPATQVTADLGREALERILRENAGWRFDETLAKVKLFIEAGEALLSLPLSEFERSGERARIEPAISKDRLQAAINWYELKRACSTRGLVAYADMTNFYEDGPGASG